MKIVRIVQHEDDKGELIFTIDNDQDEFMRVDQEEAEKIAKENGLEILKCKKCYDTEGSEKGVIESLIESVEFEINKKKVADAVRVLNVAASILDARFDESVTNYALMDVLCSRVDDLESILAELREHFEFVYSRIELPKNKDGVH